MCNMCDGNSKVEANTVQLIKELMDKYNIPIDNVLRHFDVTNKLCPKPYIDDTA